MNNNQRQEQFLKLYEPVHKQFERFCRARVYGRMEYSDLMNETLILAFEKFGSLRSMDAFLSFLCGISIRILANANRKKQEEQGFETTILQVRDYSADTERDTEINLLYEALSHLSSDQSESLILFEIIGFSIREIAEMHKVSESAVKQRLKRGRERLTELLTYESSLKN